jgi:deazaflavin-dependent oxidoreductase (nitroreductase family)
MVDKYRRYYDQPVDTGYKRLVVDPFQKLVLNRLVKTAFELGIPPPGDALIETMGRRSGQPRITPVCDGLEGNTFWVIAQHGRQADYVRNIEANPRVRVKVSDRPRWRSGTAHIMEDDDPHERQRVARRANLARGLCVSASELMGTDFLTIRIDLDSRAKRARAPSA